MKKSLFALIICMTMLFSAACSEGLSVLSDQELTNLHQEVLAELAARGIEYSNDVSPEMEQEASEKSALLKRLADFFLYWNANNLDSMLSLCASDWKACLEYPRTELFVIMANRTPLSLTPERVCGNAGDTVRTVNAVAMIDRNNGKSAALYRFSIIMQKEDDGLWYIDPSSLINYENAEQELLPVQTGEPAQSIPEESSEKPEDTAAVTVLYYVPEGGNYYHLDQNCKSVNPKYQPIRGQFTMNELNDEPYSALKPCNVCGAPARPE